MTSSPNAGAARDPFTVVAETERLADVRRYVAGAADALGSDAALTTDLVLAATELATNVIRHSECAELTVHVDRAGADWLLLVSGAPPGFDPDLIVRPATTSAGGRGLSIVRDLMDDVAIVDIDGRPHVRCRKRVTGPRAG